MLNLFMFDVHILLDISLVQKFTHSILRCFHCSGQCIHHTLLHVYLSNAKITLMRLLVATSPTRARAALQQFYYWLWYFTKNNHFKFRKIAIVFVKKSFYLLLSSNS